MKYLILKDGIWRHEDGQEFIPPDGKDIVRHANGSVKLTVPCPDCKVENTSSYYGQTMVGFSSPEGHDHNINCRTFYFECSNPSCNKTYRYNPVNTCPVEDCDWQDTDYCVVCGKGVK